MKKTKKVPSMVKVSTPVAGIFVLLLLSASFYSGFAWNKLSHSVSKTKETPTAVFTVTKNERPELQFFVMSFCPYGNQIETILRPIFDLFKNKINLVPHYIFNKITDLDSYCKGSFGDPDQCNLYVQNKYFTSINECQKSINSDLKTCLEGSSYIKSTDGSMYSSLHGRQEANQNIREICAWNQNEDKTQWWNFIANVNKNCTAQNADTCWEEQAKSAGLDSTKITECFNQEGINLIEKEIATTEKYKVSTSPTILINEVNFPPAAANIKNGTLKIGNKIVTQDQFRTPNVIKNALCTAFKKSPSECKTILNDISGTAPAAGGCGN